MIPGPQLKVLVIGGGGREHALAWAAARSPLVAKVFCAPGNTGTRAISTNLALSATDAAGIARAGRELHIDLAILGPDGAVAAGVGDALTETGIPCFGPSVAAGRLETSKAFAKELMGRIGVPTTPYAVCTEWEQAERAIDARPGPVVVKADGLALGKGAFVCSSPDEARSVARRLLVDGELGAAGRTVVIEDRLEGEEISFFALCDGATAVMLPPACDYKGALEGGLGGNTGGMGAYCPPRHPDWRGLNELVRRRVVGPVLDEMRRIGAPFVGCLYVGAMVRAAEVSVLEFNARFGDPEAEVILPVVPDPLPLLWAAAQGRLEPGIVDPIGASVGVVAVREPYPQPVRPGGPIEGLEVPADGCLLFQMGTRSGADGCAEVAGGRVVIAVGTGPGIAAARERAYRGIAGVRFQGIRYRSDIATG